jgi:hypothetical protein
MFSRLLFLAELQLCKIKASELTHKHSIGLEIHTSEEVSEPSAQG